MNHRWLLVLLAAFIGLGVTYSLATPLFEAHDEASHLAVARYMSLNHALPPRVAPEQYALVREILKKEPDLTIPETAWEFHRRTGGSVSPASMGRTLKKLGLTRKKRA